MSDNNQTSVSGGGFLSLLTILFIGLKLGGIISWSWWWILSPIWIPSGIALVVLAIVGMVILAKNILD